jgi:hypothetical protein
LRRFIGLGGSTASVILSQGLVTWQAWFSTGGFRPLGVTTKLYRFMSQYWQSVGKNGKKSKISTFK